jgi:hypothetical protein
MNSRPCVLPTVFAVAWLALSTQGAAVPPNTLTKDETADGWLLLFDGETTFGWVPRGEVAWRVEDGTLTPAAGPGGGFVATTTEFSDYQLHAEFWSDDRVDSGVFLRCPITGEISSLTAYEVNIADRHEKWPTGSISEVARTAEPHRTAGQWNTLDLTADGDRLLVVLNGRTVVDARDARHQRGTLALQKLKGDGTIRFRNIKLKPRSARPLFNGKDLSGWTVLPDHASVYSVTPEGWLNVRNGNGDLQSTGEYGDFIFQIEIISNGTHLNSGVFFRAIPGAFWSGYESQIRNQWEANDRKKPVDFGTGGIYNRQPARQVVSTDREWFTMTIAAHGPHLATWVNGFQVADFTDTRPAAESARQGCRVKPGVLSLQGHDPTTDLSFRNLRIVELPKPRL